MCFRFAVGMYWITVAAMGPNARYKLVCSQRMRRPVFSTVHDKVALSSCSVREGVRQRVARAFGLAACSAKTRIAIPGVARRQDARRPKKS